jgi:Flp pilus assembly protein TadB
MPLQDIILTIGNLLMAASLIPSVISSDKPALSTSLLTGSILFAFGIVYVTLSLWVSVFAITLNVLLWYVLAFQKFRQPRGK